jgi:hypothetical protein
MYGKVFESMYDGTLASKGPWQALVTFQQMIVLANKDGMVDMTAHAISRRTSIPLEIIQIGIAALLAPDPDSRTPDEDGRRIVPLEEHRDWGWQIVNHLKYQALRSAEERREYLRVAQAKRRGKLKQQSTNVNNVNTVNRPYSLSTPEPEYIDKESASAFLRAGAPAAAHDARIADSVPVSEKSSLASSKPSENTKPEKPPTIAPSPPPPPAQAPPAPNVEMAMVQAYAALVKIPITGIGPGDPRLRSLLVQGATVEEITGVAMQGARSQRGSWAWVSAAVDGKRKDAARIGAPASTEPAAPRPGEVSGRMPVWVPPPPPPPETPEQREAIRERLAKARSSAAASIAAKSSDQLAAEALAALQAKRGTDFPMQTDRDDA